MYAFSGTTTESCAKTTPDERGYEDDARKKKENPDGVLLPALTYPSLA